MPSSWNSCNVQGRYGNKAQAQARYKEDGIVEEIWFRRGTRKGNIVVQVKDGRL
jgi:hypothetical protein